MICDVSKCQEDNFQGSHKIFVNQVEKYKLIGRFWMIVWTVSLLAEIGNKGEKI